MRRPAPFILALGLAACSADSPTEPPPATNYLELTAPENLVHNLQVAYRLLEIDRYRELLTGDFEFRLTEQDVRWYERDHMTYEEDSQGTGSLFGAVDVLRIEIDLPHTGPTEATELDIPAGSMKIRVPNTRLEVHAVDETTYLITTRQEFFFREGDEAKGEDPQRWYLFQWREHSESTRAVRVEGAPGAATPVPVSELTWGLLKTWFIDTSPS